MSFMVNGQNYTDNNDRSDDDFMPHSWQQSVGQVQKVEQPVLGAYLDEDEDQDYDYNYEQHGRSEDGEDEDDLPTQEEPEPVVAPTQVPVMPMDFYNKVEGFLNKAPPVLVGGDGSKKSTVEKLPTIGGSFKPPAGGSGGTGSAKSKERGARGKIQESISASKAPLDTDLLQQAFQYTDMLARKEREEDLQEELGAQGGMAQSGSEKAGRRGKNVSPEKEPKPRRRKEMESAYGPPGESHLGRNPFADGYEQAAVIDRRRNNAGAGGREESNDDLYVSLKQAASGGGGSNSARMSGSKSGSTLGVAKKSHPYLEGSASSKKKGSKSMKSSGKTKTGGAVNRLRDELVANTFNGSHGSAQGGAFSNYNAHETISTVNRDRELTRNNATTSDGFESLIENFTKGLTLNKLKQELEESQRSLERSNAFMSQAMGRK